MALLYWSSLISNAWGSSSDINNIHVVVLRTFLLGGQALLSLEARPDPEAERYLSSLQLPDRHFGARSGHLR